MIKQNEAIYRKGQLQWIGVAPDAIIAVTARYAKVPLKKGNITDFEQVPELKMINPFLQMTQP